MAGLKLLKFVRRGTELRFARVPNGDELRVDMKDDWWHGSVWLDLTDMREMRDMLNATIEHAEQVWESRERIVLTAAEVVEQEPDPEQPDGLPEF